MGYLDDKHKSGRLAALLNGQQNEEPTEEEQTEEEPGVQQQCNEDFHEYRTIVLGEVLKSQREAMNTSDNRIMHERCSYINQLCERLKL